MLSRKLSNFAWHSSPGGTCTTFGLWLYTPVFARGHLWADPQYPKGRGFGSPMGSSSSSSSSSSSQIFLEWPKQQRHHEDHHSQSKYSSIRQCCNSSGIICLQMAPEGWQGRSRGDIVKKSSSRPFTGNRKDMIAACWQAEGRNIKLIRRCRSQGWVRVGLDWFGYDQKCLTLNGLSWVGSDSNFACVYEL